MDRFFVFIFLLNLLFGSYDCLKQIHQLRKTGFLASSSLHAIVENLENGQPLSIEYQLTNVFGRFAEHKALGFTSTYSDYTPSPLSLWIPTRWSRRLRVDHPDWKKVFQSDKRITREQFESRISELPFKYPVECPLPIEVKNLIKRNVISETELRENEPLRQSIEQIFTNHYKTDPNIIDVAYYLFGGKEVLDMNVMESSILEWGRMTCADDPIIDYPAFENRVKSFLTRTDLHFLFR